MLTPSEVAVKSVIPALKRMVAKELVERYGFTQQKAATLLGVSQSAISRYDTRERGVAIDLESHPDVVENAKEIVEELVRCNLTGSALAKRIDDLTLYVIRHGYMCDFHSKVDPAISPKDCEVCLETHEAAV
jgi:predicted transcriptional regulator